MPATFKPTSLSEDIVPLLKTFVSSVSPLKSQDLVIGKGLPKDLASSPWFNLLSQGPVSTIAIS